MLISADPSDDQPIYRQIVDQLRQLLAAGTLRPGDPLPSVRQLAADLGVNLNTVAIAYRELAGEGLVKIKPPVVDLELEPIVEVLERKRCVHYHTHRADDIMSVLRL